MKKLLLVSYLIALSATTYAQASISFVNALKVDPKVYDDIAGTPYLFKDWRTGKIISYLDTVVVNLDINFNGYTNSFEIRKGDQFILLDEEYYQEVLIDNPDNPEYPLHFTKYAPGDLSGNWTLVYDEGETYSLYRTFDAGLTEDEIQDVGKTIKVRTFQDKRIYYLLKDGEVEKIRLKKKNMRAAFGKSYDAIMKANKFKLTRHADLVQFMRQLNASEN